MSRVTRRKAEVPLTEDERIRLAEARQVITDLAEREPPPEALTELGYEQRMARGRALELAVGTLHHTEGVTTHMVVETAMAYANFIWGGINTVNPTDFANQARQARV